MTPGAETVAVLVLSPRDLAVTVIVKSLLPPDLRSKGPHVIVSSLMVQPVAVQWRQKSQIDV